MLISLVVDCFSIFSNSVVLSGASTYEPKRDPSSGYRKKVLTVYKSLKDLKLIDIALYDSVPGETVPKFYGLSKISPLRSIVSSVDFVTYTLLSILLTLFGPLVGKAGTSHQEFPRLC